MLDDKILTDIKKKVLDFMRHNNYEYGKLIIDGNVKENKADVEFQTTSKIITEGKSKKIIQIEKL